MYRPATYLAFKLLEEAATLVPLTLACSAAVFYACHLTGSYLFFAAVFGITTACGLGGLDGWEWGEGEGVGGRAGGGRDE